jgi:NhaA family Na+:H+ antiporter
VALALGTRVAIAPQGVTPRHFVGAACLCGVGDTLALLMADRAFNSQDAAIAKLAVLAGSATAALLGALVLRRASTGATPSSP